MSDRNFVEFNKNWLDKIERFIYPADVISFDVFDTVIHRKTRKPTDVFDLVCEKVVHEAKYASENYDVCAFPMLRVYAEQNAREKKYAASQHHEISLVEIYEELNKISSYGIDLCSHFMEIEEDIEVSVTYANPIMLHIIKSALKNGKKVIFCSDMYASSSSIQNRLVKSGFPANIPILVSCEHNCSKHDGGLFRILKDKYKNSKNIVHIGDNNYADVHMAGKNSIKSIHFSYKDDVDSQFLKHIAKTQDNLVNSISHGIIRSIVIKQSNETNDLWHKIGAEVFGPIFLGYFLWMLDSLKRGSYQKILFLARDGHFFRKMYIQWAEKLGVNLPHDYVYASRQTLLYPGLTDLNWDRLWFQFGGKKKKSLRSICEKMGVSPVYYLKIAAESGILDINEELDSGDPKLHKFFVHAGEHFLHHSRESRESVLKYLQTFTDGFEKVAICDIGWAGNIQGGISRILRSSGSEILLDGFYFGVFPWSNINSSIHDRFHGYIVNGHDIQDLNDMLTSGGVELLEFSTTAPHGTTLGYEKINNEIAPVLENSDVDNRIQKLSSAIQEGAWSFSNEMMNIISEIDWTAHLDRSWSESFVDFVHHPTHSEARTFGVVTHSDAPGLTSDRGHLIATPLSNSQEDLDAAEKKSFWKHGFNSLYREDTQQ